MKLKGAILILSGPSGAGKSSLYKNLAKAFPKHYFSISSTTRPKRNDEIDGVHYHFISQERFEDGIAKGEFLEWAKVYGYYYGTLKMEVLEALSADKLVIFDIDVQGQKNLQKVFPKQTISVFITTKNQQTLQERLQERGSDSTSVVQKRLESALNEMRSLPNYDYLIINEDLQIATNQLLCIAKSAFCKASLYPLEPLFSQWQSDGYSSNA